MITAASRRAHPDAENGAPDVFAEARRKLFPPLHHRALAEAADALADDRTAIAEALLARHLKRKPRDPDALNLMADIARRAKRFEDAERHLRACIKLSPDRPGYRYNYAVILRRLDKYEEALAQLDELLKRDSHNPLFLDQKAGVLRKLGRDQEALVCRRTLTQEFPGSADAWLHYGHSLRSAGLQDACIAAYRKAIAIKPSLSAAYGSLADLKVYHFTAGEIATMESLLVSSGLPTETRADLHHALGKAHEDEKHYEKSFEHYAKGNALRRMGAGFDAGKLIARRRAWETLFTETFFRERADWGSRSTEPIFIVGMPRSGSTLLEQILCSHSAIEGLGELAELDIAFSRPLTAGEDNGSDNSGRISAVDKAAVVDAWLQPPGRLDATRARAMGETYLELTGRRRAGRPFFTDKTLSNFLYIALIQLTLPCAKIIDIRRFPLDCGWSCFKSQFAGGGQSFSYRLGDIGHYYAEYVRLMAHFDRVLPGRIHRVIYENLVADPKQELLRLFEYLNLPFEEQCLRFHENTRAVATLSSEQVRRPLYRSGMAQWVPYGPWLGPLKSALGEVLDTYPNAPNDADRSLNSQRSSSGTEG